MELDDNFKRLVQELGQAINSALTTSEDVADVMGRIRAAGYDLLLVLELTIGFNKRAAGEGVSADGETSHPPVPLRLTFSPEDARFLRALKINLDGEN